MSQQDASPGAVGQRHAAEHADLEHRHVKDHAQVSRKHLAQHEKLYNRHDTEHAELADRHAAEHEKAAVAAVQRSCLTPGMSPNTRRWRSGTRRSWRRSQLDTRSNGSPWSGRHVVPLTASLSDGHVREDRSHRHG